jgi:hypothetical protein
MPQELNEKLAAVFAAKWQAENRPDYADMLDKFLFHLSDASHDIRQIADLLQHPEAADCATFGKLLHRFFLHALPHLVAAGQLYDYVPEIFPEQHGVHAPPTNDRVEEKNSSTPASSAASSTQAASSAPSGR